MQDSQRPTDDQQPDLNWVQKAAIAVVTWQAAKITYRLASHLAESFKPKPPEDEMTRRWRKTAERQARRREERGSW